MESDADSDDLRSRLSNRKRFKRLLTLQKHDYKRRRCSEDIKNITKRRHLVDLSTSSQTSESSTKSPANSSSSSSRSSSSSSSRSSSCSSSNSSLTSSDVNNYSELAKGAESVNNTSVCYSSSSSNCSITNELRMKDAGTRSLWDHLRRDALRTNMTETQVNCLLKTLRKHNVGPLPLDSRTLMKTPNTFSNQIKQVSGMEYYYFGFAEQVIKTLSRYPPGTLNGIDMLIIKDNIDGLPLYKSSSTCLWPLLAKIDNLKPSLVFPILITAGKNKPQDLEFLEEAVSEMNSMEENGITFKGKIYRIKFAAHVCDTPARNMIKACVHFNAYHGCDFCMERGHYDGKRMTWPKTKELRIRTDRGFRDREQEEHHKNYMSPYEKTTADMILSFPIDFMHLGGGVMKKLMKFNLFLAANNTRLRCKMSSTNVKILDSRLEALRSCIPNCFARKPRTTKDLQRYKATELRQLLLYTSRLVFKGLMASDEQYRNLCFLSTGCCLLVDPRTAQTKNEVAKELLERFCESAKELYGTSFLVYNVHSLLHLPRVAMTHGSLDSVSAYAFESYLGEMKRSIKSARHPIFSAVKAVTEKQEAYKSQEIKMPEPKIYKDYPNNCYVDINRNKCYDVFEINGSSVHLREYSTQPFFHQPVSSSLIGCYKIRKLQYKYVNLNVEDVLSMRRGMRVDLNRMPGFEENDEAVCSALLHDGHHRY